MVQLHLFVVESQAKGHGAQRIPAQTESQNSPQGKTQTHSIVPDAVKVNIQRAGMCYLRKQLNKNTSGKYSFTYTTLFGLNIHKQ